MPGLVENTPCCEQTAAGALLERLPALDGKLVTADPLHCQRACARSIVEKGGDSLFQIKGNQPGLLAQARKLDARRDTPLLAQTESGHGQRTTWQLHAFDIEPWTADFRFARSLVGVRTERTIKKTGQMATESRYYICSPEAGEHTALAWLGLIRGHWGGVENQNPWRRDALMGKDGSRSRNPNLLVPLALIGNALLAVLAQCPGRTISAGIA